MLWLALVACSGDDGPALGGERTGTEDGDDRYLYEDVGIACLASVGGTRTEVQVDFQDCLFCFEADLSCEYTVDGTRIEVTAGGTLVLRECETSRSTCAPVTVACDGPILDAGTRTLAYAGREVTFEGPVPDEESICTGDSAAL
jgi:hypothetical protein